MDKLEIEGVAMEDGIRAMGPFFVEELKESAEASNCPAAVRRDWYTVAAWLEHTGGPLSKEQKQMIAQAWTSYISISVAPSHKLQPVFDEISRDLNLDKKRRPPAAVLDVFDRLLATDEEISLKRASDLRDEKQQIQKVLNGISKPSRSVSYLERRKFRQKAFAAFSWALGVYLYAWLFDPFDVGGWDDLDFEQFQRLFVIAMLPPLIYLLMGAYRHWVK